MWDQLRAELALSWRTYSVIVRVDHGAPRDHWHRRSNYAALRGILVPLDGMPTLITHETYGLKPGAEVTFDEVVRGARRKT